MLPDLIDEARTSCGKKTALRLYSLFPVATPRRYLHWKIVLSIGSPLYHVKQAGRGPSMVIANSLQLYTVEQDGPGLSMFISNLLTPVHLDTKAVLYRT